MAETMYLQCPACRAEFRSPIQMTRATLEKNVVSGNQAVCPECKAPVLVDNAAALWKDE